MIATKRRKITKRSLGIFDPTFDFTGKEKDIELHILDHVEEISESAGWGKVKNVYTQTTFPYGGSRIIIDILLLHTDGSATLIEVKSSKTNRNDSLYGIGQLLYYGQVVKENIGHQPRMVLASDQIIPEAIIVSKTYSIPINYLMIDGDRVIYQ